jgi:hypothetical protein
METCIKCRVEWGAGDCFGCIQRRRDLSETRMIEHPKYWKAAMKESVEREIIREETERMLYELDEKGVDIYREKCHIVIDED